MNIDGSKLALLLGLTLTAVVLLVTRVLPLPTKSPEEAMGARTTPPGASTHSAAQERRPRKRLRTQPELVPSAHEFAQAFIEATARYARTHGDPARISNADCVQATRGRYMCSFAVNKPDVPRISGDAAGAEMHE
jgi:hypothetical protein